MTVVTRFAPSPTGFLHIGGARTALFNWLFARHHAAGGGDGKFLLRIEDTDRKRSTDAAVRAIIDGLTWLGLDWDGEPVSQFSRAVEHKAAAERLLGEGKAYRCYCSPAELDDMRRAARQTGKPVRYNGMWRDRGPAAAPAGIDPVIRFKAPKEGETVIRDLVQGEVRIANDQLDDMILLRADGTPTYMLAVVVDDHDMEISHVIRGDDHLTNAFRHTGLFTALGWTPPEYAHIPLIHGPDGAKLSKRHGALGVEAYRDMGFLPEALRNYLLRLGWAHGDDEIIPTGKAVEWFDLGAVGKSAARFDIAKLSSLNAHYMRNSDDQRLVALITPGLSETIGRDLGGEEKARLTRGMGGLKERAKTVVELAANAAFYVAPRPLEMNAKAAKLLNDDGKSHLAALQGELEALADWTRADAEQAARALAEARGVKLGKIAQPLRAALTGSNVSPGIFEVLEVLGRDEALARIDDVLG
jgi:glutamyl-tRNA synthetase